MYVVYFAANIVCVFTAASSIRFIWRHCNCPLPQKELRSVGSCAVWLVCLARLALMAPCLTHPQRYSSVSMCVLLVQSRAVRQSRGLDSAVQTLSPGDKDPPVLVRFMRTLISHAGSSGLTLSQPAITCSPCTCPPKDVSPQFPLCTFSLHLTSPLLPTPPPPLHVQTLSLSYWSQLEISQHNQFWALSSSPHW